MDGYLPTGNMAINWNSRGVGVVSHKKPSENSISPESSMLQKSFPVYEVISVFNMDLANIRCFFFFFTSFS